MINEHDKYPNNKEQYDINWLRVFGYCNANNCPKNWACYRYTEGVGKNNKTFVPKPNNYDTCKFYVAAKCSLCNGLGYNKDYDKTQRKFINTDCLICKGTGKLNYEDMVKVNKEQK